MKIKYKRKLLKDDEAHTDWVAFIAKLKRDNILSMGEQYEGTECVAWIYYYVE